MRVKHHRVISAPRKQPGSGAQGASLGNHEFSSQTNNNADSVPEENRFKYVDDLTTLEIINLLSIGLSSFNVKKQVPSDIPIDGYYVDSSNLQSQQYLNQINEWTTKQKMLLNTKKTKAMIINFTNKHQFTTRIQLNNTNIEVVDSMKILGTTVTKDLNWNINTQDIIKKVNRRMLLLKRIQNFGASVSDMIQLWRTYCLSVLEQSSVVWGSSLSEENKNDLERTQKCFTKLILKNKYKTYEESLLYLNLETLEKRRQDLSLKFAKDCIKNEKFKSLFEENENQVNTRHSAKYQIPHSNTERMKKSCIITMKNQLNRDHN